jgi:hypothetical protein
MMLRSNIGLVAVNARNTAMLRSVTTARKCSSHGRNMCYDVPLREESLDLPHGRNVTLLSLGVTLLRFSFHRPQSLLCWWLLLRWLTSHRQPRYSRQPSDRETDGFTALRTIFHRYINALSVSGRCQVMVGKRMGSLDATFAPSLGWKSLRMDRGRGGHHPFGRFIRVLSPV